MSPFSYSKVPVIELAMTLASAPTYSDFARIFTASARLALSFSSSHMAARIRALTRRLWVSGLASAQALDTPRTFSGLFFQIS
ncbi:hypothetical protein D3C72_1770540 [compost metagenome]